MDEEKQTTENSKQEGTGTDANKGYQSKADRKIEQQNAAP
jgi:hypothetical protein|tara:strand:- start:890 stop:1009 length:120 start_codon:yes stop_codon:yes gene_type:complete